jgi:hypothetical protein
LAKGSGSLFHHADLVWETALLSAFVAILAIVVLEQIAQLMLDIYCRDIGMGASYWPWQTAP